MISAVMDGRAGAGGDSSGAGGMQQGGSRLRTWAPGGWNRRRGRRRPTWTALHFFYDGLMGTTITRRDFLGGALGTAVLAANARSLFAAAARRPNILFILA